MRETGREGEREMNMDKGQLVILEENRPLINQESASINNGLLPIISISIVGDN